MGWSLVAICGNWVIHRCRTAPYFKTLSFLDWCTQDRMARSRAEIDSYGLSKFMRANKEEFASLADKDGIVDVVGAYQEMINLK